MAQFKEIHYGVCKKIANETTHIRLNGRDAFPFEGDSFKLGGLPPPDRPGTRGAAALSQPFQDKGVQTQARAPGSITLWERNRRHPPAKPKQQAVFVGEANRIDGGKVDPKLKNRVPKRKPKMQFSKKKAPSASPKQPAVRKAPPVPKVVEAPVQTALSSRGRVIRRSSRFDPSIPQNKIKSISRRSRDGLYRVVMLMTEEEVLQAGGGSLLGARAKK